MKKSKILIFIGLFQLIGFTAFANHTEDNYPDGDQRGHYHSAPNYNKGSSTSVGDHLVIHCSVIQVKWIC